MKLYKIAAMVIALTMLALPMFSVVSQTKAAELTDGAWTHNSPGSGKESITITLSTALVAGDYIYLTFNQGSDAVQATVSDARVNTTASTAVSNVGAKTIRITVPTGGVSGTATVDGTFLSTYDSTTYAQHSVAINTTDSGDNSKDYGVAVTVTNDNDNTVDITASVPNFINMSLSDNTVDLGVLNTSSVSTGSHTLGVNTNDTNGYMVQIQADGALDDGFGNDIDDVIENNTVTAGTEGYGIAVTAGNSANEQGDFTDDDTPIPTSATNFIEFPDAASSHSHTITYRAAISGNTSAGTYSQVVTYTVATQ